MYFTLKDGGSELRCTMFRMNNSYLKFKPSDGMEVRLFGLVTVYEKRGQVQFKVTNMEPLGLGDLYRAYELLKRSLNDEGLFLKVAETRVFYGICFYVILTLCNTGIF